MQFLLYCLCGGMGVLCDFGIFTLVLSVGGVYQAANATGYLAGTLVSFVLNRKITFGIRDQIARRLAMFLAVALVGYLTSALLLWFLIDLFLMDARLAKLLTLPVVVALQFSLNRARTFRQSRPDLTHDE